jgi:hypothetical protein
VIDDHSAAHELRFNDKPNGRSFHPDTELIVVLVALDVELSDLGSLARPHRRRTRPWRVGVGRSVELSQPDQPVHRIIQA